MPVQTDAKLNRAKCLFVCLSNSSLLSCFQSKKYQKKIKWFDQIVLETSIYFIYGKNRLRPDNSGSSLPEPDIDFKFWFRYERTGFSIFKFRSLLKEPKLGHSNSRINWNLPDLECSLEKHAQNDLVLSENHYKDYLKWVTLKIRNIILSDL